MNCSDMIAASAAVKVNRNLDHSGEPVPDLPPTHGADAAASGAASEVMGSL
jgi:hypothetical protein